jgi:uncharacterized protein YPO0396
MQLAEELKKRERLTQELAEIDLEHRQLQNEIEQAGGERLRQIPHLIRLAETQSANTRETSRRYHQALDDAEISGEVCDMQRFVEIRETLPQRLDELTIGAKKTEKQHEEQLIERATVSRRLAEDEEEFLALNKRQGNLPEFLVAARRQLCADLRLSDKDLPYVAELIAVKIEERGWEASVEMVLRNFALSLLVPRHLYRSVSAHVDRTRLVDANGRGIRLVYLNVGPRTEDVSGPVPAPNSLCRKLEYRDGHSLLPWVKAELEERYNYRCCETIAEFQEAGGLALTRERHAKLHSTRHDKNDREDASDPRRFVLGWDNRAKRELLAAEIRKLQEEVQSRDRQLDRLREQLAKSRNLQAAIRAALEFEEFSAIDFRFHEKQVAELQLERQRLEESNDKVRVLKKRLAEVNTRKLATESFREESIEKAGALRSKIEDAEKMLATALRALERRRLTGLLDQDRKEFESLEQQFAAAPLDSVSLYNREREFLAERGEAVAKLQQYLEPLRNELLKSMTRYLREFADERADLEADVRSLEDFLRVREQILEDDLPRFEQRFKERLNEKVIQEIAFFHGDLQTESTEITRRIEALNVSLRQLEYSNHSYMRLEPRPTRDPEILAFRNELRQCLAGSFEGSPEADEARFRKIEKLIERLEKEERWRDRVIDVRRWFNFAARELDLETNAEKNYHEDSSGQSGGEKAKLAFTILVASIAYQYDIDVLQPASDRFHFVVVDEMFSKVDDQHAEYALNLFDKFGLQLLIVAPLDAKARVTEPYVGCYLLVAKDEDTNRSEIHSMTAREFEETVAGVG